jgi:hypothetical protein
LDRVKLREIKERALFAPDLARTFKVLKPTMGVETVVWAVKIDPEKMKPQQAISQWFWFIFI